MTFLQSNTYLYVIMHIKCEIDLEMEFFFKNKGLNCYTHFLNILLMSYFQMMAMIYFPPFIINITSVLNKPPFLQPTKPK